MQPVALPAPSAAPWLTDAEIDDMCEGLTQNAAKVKYLRLRGYCVDTKPNGRPLVARSNFETVRNGGPAQPAGAAAEPGKRRPDREAYRLYLAAKRA